jgi:hypothetical protein
MSSPINTPTTAMISTAMDTEPTQSESKKTWLTEGILIASVPVFTYILMIAFVIGYCDFFLIPVSFVSLNLSTMLWIGLRLEVGLFFVLFFTAPAYWILRSYSNKIANTVLVLLPYAGLLLLQISLRLPWRDWRWSLVSLAAFIAASFFFYFSPGPFPPSMLRSISPNAANMIVRASLVLPWLAISVSVAMNMGRAVATDQRDYLVPASAPTTVVLSHFGERLIVAPFDRSTKEVEPSFWVIKTGEDPKLLLRWERVGPLHPKPEGASSTPASATTPTQPPKPSSPEKHAP